MSKRWRGKPLNPERDGFHWLKLRDFDMTACAKWDAGRRRWFMAGDADEHYASDLAETHCYLGPAMPPGSRS